MRPFSPSTKQHHTCETHPLHRVYRAKEPHHEASILYKDQSQKRHTPSKDKPKRKRKEKDCDIKRKKNKIKNKRKTTTKQTKPPTPCFMKSRRKSEHCTSLDVFLFPNSFFQVYNANIDPLHNLIHPLGNQVADETETEQTARDPGKPR